MNGDAGSQVCSHRRVAKDSRIVCELIASGDNEVSADLCHDCPARTIDCEHLRFSLQKTVSSPIIVRYATGRVETLDDHPSHITFLRAACAQRVAPIGSPRECAGCALHSARAAVSGIAAVTLPVTAPGASLTGARCGSNIVCFPSQRARRSEKLG
jgi:hypothetical protein